MRLVTRLVCAAVAPMLLVSGGLALNNGRLWARLAFLLTRQQAFLKQPVLIVVNSDACASMYHTALSGAVILVPARCEPNASMLAANNVSFRVWNTHSRNYTLQNIDWCIDQREFTYLVRCSFVNNATILNVAWAADYLRVIQTSSPLTIHHIHQDAHLLGASTVASQSVALYDVLPILNPSFPHYIPLWAEEVAHLPTAENTTFHYIWSTTTASAVSPNDLISNIIDNSIKNICAGSESNSVILWVLENYTQFADIVMSVKDRVRRNVHGIQTAMNYVSVAPITSIDHCNITVRVIDLDAEAVGTPYEGILRRFYNDHRFDRLFFAHFTDLFRLVVLYKYAGWYIDTDALVLRPVMHDRLLLSGEAFYIVNSPIYTPTPKHPFIELLMEKHLPQIRSYDSDCWGCFSMKPFFNAASTWFARGDFAVTESDAMYFQRSPAIRTAYVLCMGSPRIAETARRFRSPIMHLCPLNCKNTNICKKRGLAKALVVDLLGQNVRCS